MVLIKPLGKGILSTDLKSEKKLGDLEKQANQTMTILNKIASEVMQEIGVNACTDVTGFGLLGHAHEMAAGSKVDFKIWASNLLYFKGAIPLITKGVDTRWNK